MLACYRYIELNPVRAQMVEHPADYPWSSYRPNAQGHHCTWLSPHLCYLDLGHVPEQRQSAYRELFRHELEPGMIDRIRRSTNGNYVLGSDRFSEQVAAMLARRVVPGKPGRPPKPDNQENG